MSRTLVIVAAVGLLAAACSKSAQQYYQNGNRYLDEKKYREAVVEYRNAIQKDPRFGDARLKLAECYERLNDVAGAYQQYVRAADLLPGNVEAQLKAGTFLFLARKYPDASARADLVLKKDPRNVRALILKGDAAAMLQDLDGAIKQMEEAIQIDPATPRAYTELGMIQAQKGNAAAAEQAFRQAVQVDPKSVEAELALANFFLQANRRAEGEDALKAARALDPKNVLANRALALFYISSNRAAEAEPYLKAIADTTGDLHASLSLADYYAATRRTADATTLLEKLAKTKEGFAPARIRLAAIQYAEGKKPEAHRTIDEVLAKEPKNDSALVVKARFLLGENRLDDAVKQAQAAVAANPRSAGAQYLLGSVLASKNNPEEAVKAFNEVLKINPRAAAAQLQLSRLAMTRGFREGAVQYAEQAVASAPNNALTHLVLARSLMAAGKLPQAESEMRALVQQFPNVSAVQASMGALNILKKDTAGARRSYESALRLDPNSVEALAGLVALDLAAKKPAEARARVEARVAQSPNDSTLLVLAARTYATTGVVDKAEQTLLRALEVDADNLQVYGLLGQLYLAQKRLDAARQKFEELAKRQPKPVGAETMVAMISQIQGNKAEAQKRYRRVLEIDPRAPVAANNLAWMEAEGGGNLDVALQLAQTAKAGLPDSPEVSDTLGWVYYKKDMAGLALAPLRAAVEKTPANPTYHYHLGMALWRAGDIGGSRKELAEAIRLNPDFDGAAEAKKTLAALQ